MLLCAVPAAAECGQGSGERGIVLMVGNGAYDGVHWPRLANAVNDIDHVCQAFAKAGFAIMDVRNADIAALREVEREFGERAATAPMAIVYFAGHGFEYEGRNFMVPVDSPLFVRRSELDRHFMPLENLANAAARSSGFSLFLMDACRTAEPVVRLEDFSAKDPRGGISALGLLNISQGAVFYSTAKGRPALDAAPPGSPTSPFANAVASKLAIPGLELSDYFKFVSREVYQNTKGLEFGPQQPFHYGSWFENQYLRAPEKLPSGQQFEAGAGPGKAISGGLLGAIGGAIGTGKPRQTVSAETLAAIKADLAKYDLATVDEPLIVADMLEKYLANEILAAAEGGNWRARYLLGYMYHFGLGVARDLGEARFWLTEAAKSGEAACATELAYFLQENDPSQREEALRLYELAVAAGYAKAQSHLGYALWHGTLGPSDRDRAVKLFTAAAEAGHPYASFATAIYGGDFAGARQRLEALAQAGNLDGANWLCELDYQQNSLDAGLPRCLTAAQGGFAGPQAILAKYYSSGRLGPEAMREARFWAALAQQQRTELAGRSDLLPVVERLSRN